MSHQPSANCHQPSAISHQPSVRREFLAGVAATLPLLVGVVPFGMVFGALALTAGLSARGAIAMSVFVFAGSAQFIAAGLLATGTGAWLIVLTTLVVNLRHLLYGATLAPYLRHLSRRWQMLLAHVTTDETYAVSILHYQSEDESSRKHWYFLGSALALMTTWVTSTAVGIIAGQTIPDPLAWGFDFALPIIFIGLLTPHVKDRPTLAAMAVAGLVAIAAHRLPNNLWLLLAALAGIAAGVWAEGISSSQETIDGRPRTASSIYED
jgi:4-azaleucine resistance transporter AzlC